METCVRRRFALAFPRCSTTSCRFPMEQESICFRTDSAAGDDLFTGQKTKETNDDAIYSI